METLKWTLVLFMTRIAVHADHDEGAELELHSTEGDTILVSKTDYMNVTFWLSPTTSERSHDDYYIIEVQTRCSDGRVQYEGRVLLWNKECKVSYQQSIRCISETGPAELYRKVNCSEMDVEWVWTWKDSESGKLKSKKKNVKLLKESYSLESGKKVTSIIIGTCIVIAVITMTITIICLLLRLQKAADFKGKVDLETADYIEKNHKENTKFLDQEEITFKKQTHGSLSRNGGGSSVILFSITSAFKTFTGAVAHLCKLRVINVEQLHSFVPVNEPVNQTVL